MGGSSVPKALASRQPSMADGMRQPAGPFPKLTKNCETHVHIARLIRYFMRQGKVSPEWERAASEQLLAPHMAGRSGKGVSPQKLPQGPAVITPTPHAPPVKTDLHPTRCMTPTPVPAAQPTRPAVSLPPRLPMPRAERPEHPQPSLNPLSRASQPPLPGHVQQIQGPFYSKPAAIVPGSQPLAMPHPSPSGFLPPSLPGAPAPLLNGNTPLLPGGMPSLLPNLQQAFSQGIPNSNPTLMQSLPSFARSSGEALTCGFQPNQSPLVMGSLPPHLMPPHRQQRGRQIPSKAVPEQIEPEQDMPPVISRLLPGAPLPGGPRDGLLPAGPRSDPRDGLSDGLLPGGVKSLGLEGKLRSGEPGPLMRSPYEQLGGPHQHMLPHSHPAVAVSASLQLPMQLGSLPSASSGASPSIRLACLRNVEHMINSEM